MRLTRLMVNNKFTPIGLGDRELTFSWNVEMTVDNWKQVAYEILVSDSERLLDKNQGNIWSTQKIVDCHMVNIIYKGKTLKSDKRYFWKVRVWSEDGEVSSWSDCTFFEMGLLEKNDWEGKWIGEVVDHQYHIYRKSFMVKHAIQKAQLYISGLGHYELCLNGEKVGDYVLEPGWTNYDKSCLYSTYDVTKKISKGKNGIGIILGDGMFNVPGGRYVYYTRSYGKAKCLMQLNITYEDGSKESIVTDESWRMAKSPIGFSCIYGGEDYDSRLEQKGYSLAEFVEDKGWSDVCIVEAPKGELKSQDISPLKVMQELEPISVYETQPGVYLYDLGKNFSGWARMVIEAGKNCCGTEIVMTPSEIITKDKQPDQSVTGRGYKWTYTMNEEYLQSWHPRFTYYGFRYVQVEGAVPACLAKENETRPVIKKLVGEFIYPDMEIMGEFACSNELFNNIHQLINQAMLSNIKSVFTDCPHREKLGWLEETYLIGPAMMYNYNLHSLYKKIERDMEEAQYDSGLVPDIAPEYVVFGYHEGFVDSPEWGSACIINPWYIYKKYGDMTLLKKHYRAMCRYIDYLTSRTHHSILHHGLGDWLDIGPHPPYSQNTPVPVVATAIYYYDLSIMSQVANLLGKKSDTKRYTELMQKVKEEYNLQFYDHQTYRYATGSQAAQAMSLMVGLVEKEHEERVFEYLVKDIELREYSTTAGDIGHPFVLAALTHYKRDDVVSKMMHVVDKPSYGYQIKCGATTLTEEWDGPNLDKPHGSQNHLMLGSGEEWFYSGLAGIRSIRVEKSFDELIIAPHFAKNVDWVRAWHRQPYGKIHVEWMRQEGSILLKVIIPPNTCAELVLEKGELVKKLGAGTYHFETKE